MPNFARASSAAAGGFDGFRWGVNASSNHSKYVSFQKWLDFVVGNYGFHTLGKISRHPQPAGIGREQSPINADREVFAFDDVFCPAEAVLPTFHKSGRVQRGDKKLNP